MNFIRRTFQFVATSARLKNAALLLFCMAQASTAVADSHTNDPTLNERTFTDGNIREVTDDGILIMTSGNETVLWGLSLRVGPELDSLLNGRRVQCRILDRRDDTIFADCKLSPTDWRPPLPTDYLDLFTWLPQFGLARPVCGAGGFGDNYRIMDLKFGEVISEESLGPIGYGCPGGVPVRDRTI